jgi:hypothetical protein
MQSVKPVGTIHNGAASTVFPVLLIMCTIQTGITCKIQHVFGGHGVLLGVQVALTVFCWLAGITCVVGFIGWHFLELRRTAAFGEWAMYTGIILYPLTFCKDFRMHRVKLDVQWMFQEFRTSV